MVLTNTFLDDIKSQAKSRIIATHSYGAIGTGTTSASATDTTLETEILRKARQEYTEGTDDVTVSTWIASTEANGNTVSEHGVLDASSSGNLWDRFVFTGISKTSDIELWFDVQVTVSVTES